MLTVHTRDAVPEPEGRTRAFDCPGCGEPHVVIADEDEPPIEGRTLQFDFECYQCGYKAGMGVL